jgi:hypothetical protein
MKKYGIHPSLNRWTLLVPLLMATPFSIFFASTVHPYIIIFIAVVGYFLTLTIGLTVLLVLLKLRVPLLFSYLIAGACTTGLPFLSQFIESLSVPIPNYPYVLTEAAKFFGVGAIGGYAAWLVCTKSLPSPPADS